MLKLKLQYFGPWCKELTHLLKRPWCWERLRAGGEGDDRGWDGWMASPTQWTWVWVDSRSWWWTGRPGVLWFMGSQRVGHDWVTNWTELFHLGLWGTKVLSIFIDGSDSCDEFRLLAYPTCTPWETPAIVLRKRITYFNRVVEVSRARPMVVHRTPYPLPSSIWPEMGFRVVVVVVQFKDPEIIYKILYIFSEKMMDSFN